MTHKLTLAAALMALAAPAFADSHAMGDAEAGEKDFRIPYTQGLAAFTALQRREIPSRLVVFPDENHWVLKPKNSLQWYDEALGWLDQWTGAAKGK